MWKLSRLLGMAATASFVLGIGGAVAMIFFLGPFAMAPGLTGYLGVILGIHCLIGMACAAAYERGRWRALMVSGLAATGFSAVLVTVMFVSGMVTMSEPSTTLIAVTSTVGLYGAFCMVLALTSSIPGSGRIVRAIITCSLVTGVGAACLLVVTVWSLVLGISNETVFFLFRIAFALMIVAFVAGTIARLMARDVVDLGEEQSGPKLPMRATCPRCLLSQTIHTGGDHCAQCGLAIKVNLL